MKKFFGFMMLAIGLIFSVSGLKADAADGYSMDPAVVTFDRNGVGGTLVQVCNTDPTGTVDTLDIGSVKLNGETLTPDVDYTLCAGIDSEGHDNRANIVLKRDTLMNLPQGSDYTLQVYDRSDVLMASSTVKIPGTWTVTFVISPEDSGYVKQGNCILTDDKICVNKGEPVTVSAGPYRGYVFKNFESDAALTVSEEICTLTPTGDTTVTVNFEEERFALALNKGTGDFGLVQPGYTQPAAQMFSITNTGNQRIEVKQPSAENYIISRLSYPDASPAVDFVSVLPGTRATFAVQPKEGLPVGVYDASVTILGGQYGMEDGDNDRTSLPLQLKFEVSEEIPAPDILYHTLKFETNGGSFVDDITEKENTFLDISIYKTAKKDDTFVCWCSDKELTHEVRTLTLDKAMTVYAKWESDVRDIPKTGDNRGTVLWSAAGIIALGAAARLLRTGRRKERV